MVHNILIFGRLLRSTGMPMSAGREMELLRALRLIDVGNRQSVYEACQAMLVSRRDQLPIFDRAFRLFFSRLSEQPLTSESSGSETGEAEEVGGVPPPMSGEDNGEISLDDVQVRSKVAPEDDKDRTEEGEDPSSAQTFSAIESLRNKDFEDYSPDEIAQARELMRQLRLRPGVRQTRRLIPTSNGRRLDMRAIVRGMQRTVGEPVRLAWRDQKVKRRQLVLICDISGSMERYSRVLLQFLHAARQGLNDVEVFVFGTRLTRVTRDMANRDVDVALERIAERVLDFSGGTRIGYSIHDFNHEWGRRVLGHGAVVIIISDGWDRGDPELLGAEMEHLQRGAFRVIWLNPLLGLPEYQPITLGMRTALQFVDDFLPAHNLASLEDLARRLGSLEQTRPVRRQSHLPQV